MISFGFSQKIAKYIMRPPRTKYVLNDMGAKAFKNKQKVFERIEFQVKNNRKQSIQCSLFRIKYSDQKRQTIVFLHANSSSRLAVKNYLADLVQYFNIVCFDCAGSGVSEGNYVSLGYHQKEDLKSVLEGLKSEYGLDRVILWGRSMGAVTALLYTAKYECNIQALVVDNAFSDLEQICKQLKDHYFSLLPDFCVDILIDSAQDYINETINKREKYNFQIKLLKPKNVVKEIKCPIIYVYSENDTIVNNRHSWILYELSNNPKRIIPVKGDHNSPRDSEIKNKIIKYLFEMIQSQQKEKNELSKQYAFNEKYNKNQSYTNKNSIQTIASGIGINEEETEIGIVFDSPLNEKFRENFMNFRQGFINENQLNNKRELSIIQRRQSKLSKQVSNQVRQRRVKSFQLLEDEQEQSQDISEHRNRISYSVNYFAQSSFLKEKRKRKKIFDN